MTLLTPSPKMTFPLTLRSMDCTFTVVARYGAYYLLNEKGDAVRCWQTAREMNNAIAFAQVVTAEYDRRVEDTFRAITDEAIDLEADGDNSETCEDYLDCATLNAIEFTAWNEDNNRPATSKRLPVNIFDAAAVVLGGLVAGLALGGK